MAAQMERAKKLIAEKGPAALLEMMGDANREPDMPQITEEDIENSDTEIAVYVLARNSGEGKDRKAEAGDYELSAIERQNLDVISKAYVKTIVVLNVGGVIDTKVIRGTEGVGAVLLMSQAGNIINDAVVFIEVDICGENGEIESNADELLTIHAEGAEILGFGSGRGRTEESFVSNQYTSYYGRAALRPVMTLF